jgi:hypothetical protein
MTDINTVQIAAGEGEERPGGDHEDSGEPEELMTDINTVQIAAGEGEKRRGGDHEDSGEP